MAQCTEQLHATILHPETGEELSTHDLVCTLEYNEEDGTHLGEDGSPSDHMADHPHDDNPHPVAWPNAIKATTEGA